MNGISSIIEHVDAAERISIAVHTHPDGDAVGSGTALASYLSEMRGKDVEVIVPDTIRASLSFIYEGTSVKVAVADEDLEAAERRIGSSDLVFCLDCNSFSRTADLEACLNASGATKILIDHHLSPDREAFDLVFSETEISSASELLFRILMEMPDIQGDAGKLPKTCATALMAGMTTDTNNFANSVFPGTLEMASRLIAAGVDRDGILNEIYNSYNENRLRLMGYLLSRKLRITPEGVAYMILDDKAQKRFNVVEGDTEAFVNMPLAVSKVRMSIFLTQEKGKFRVSLRSKKGTSANQCAMRYFNGGGHEMAAGGKLFIGKDIARPQDAEAYIIESTEEFFRR